MANVVRKLYRYLSASANRKLDEKADPRVQIDQALDEARKQHKALVEQAAAVIGNRKQLEMQIARQIDDVEKLTDSARQAVLLAERAQVDGQAGEAADFERSAHTFAAELVAAESALADTKSLYDQAVASSEQARQAVSDSEARLRSQLAERARLLTQLEHTAMQERMSKAMAGMSSLEPAGDTPTLAEVRDKIERRYAVATSRQELASAGVEAKMVQIRRAAIEARATDRLDEIKAALAAGRSTGADAPSLTKGPGGAAAERPGDGTAPPDGSAG